MGIRNKVTGEMYSITSYNPTTGNITGINNVGGNSDLGNVTVSNITFPNTSTITEVNAPISGQAIVLAPYGGTPTQILSIYPTAVDGDHVHLTSGNLWQSELFLGSDALYVKLANTGNIGFQANDDNGNIAQWTMGVDGSTTFPNGAKLNATVSTQFATDNGVVTSIDMRDTSGAGFYTNGGGYTLRSNGTKNWIFDTDGNLRTPGNVDIYGAINFPQQVSSINWSTYNIELSQYGRINTNVDFFANANVIGAQYLKGDGSNITNVNAVQVINGTSNVTVPTTNGNVAVSVGSNSWVFGTDSNLTLADGGFLVVSGGIVGGGASPAPYLSGFSSLATVGTLGNITASGFFVGDGSLLTNLPTPAPVIDFVASASTIAPPVGATQYNITALAESATIAAPVGTPLDGQKLTIRILDNGTPQTLTWNAIYQVIGTILPTTTVANKYVYVGCIYNAQDTTWDVVSVATQA